MTYRAPRIIGGTSDDVEIATDGSTMTLKGDAAADGTAAVITNSADISTGTLMAFRATEDGEDIAEINGDGSASFDDLVSCGGVNAGSQGLTTSGHLSIGNGITWTAGAGSPEGAVTAQVGSLYSRTDGTAGTSIYIKYSGTGNTGWNAVAFNGL